MVEAIETFLSENLPRELCVIVCSMLPIIELRGGIPLATSLGLPWWQSFLFAVLGNMIPVPFILIFIRAVLEFMKKFKGLRSIALWLEKKADKHRDKVEKYSFWGLFALVAIPLPGTGAWTGSLVAAMIRMKFPKALLSVFLGVVAAGTVVTLISYGVLGFLSFLI